MILPTKHLPIQESFLGAGTIVLEELKRPITVARLWHKLRGKNEIGGYSRFTLILAFLYSVDAIEYNENLLRRRDSRL